MKTWLRAGDTNLVPVPVISGLGVLVISAVQKPKAVIISPSGKMN